ncbi:MAG: hypothetical protein J1F16_07650 [Muribaculaceae bacterium]|nr:hypothetical protein [Muribaculaceae bacterium]
MRKGYFFLTLGCMILIFLSGCIHEYPVPSAKGKEKGENPTLVDAYITVNLNLDWSNLIHQVEFLSRATTNQDHRIVMELRKDGVVVYRNSEYISDNEFSKGTWNHRIVNKLTAAKYEVAVWYDKPGDKEPSFLTDELGAVRLNNFSTANSEYVRGAHVSDILDLSPYSGIGNESGVTKELKMEHSGARFEIVATDINEFISQQKEALINDDSFTVNISLDQGACDTYNVYEGRALNFNWPLLLSGHMRLPFAEYDELKIAEGFFFCEEETEARATLFITNSSGEKVTETGSFTFPIKRGQITTVCGDFLTKPVDGIFSINHTWNGEIYFPI